MGDNPLLTKSGAKWGVCGAFAPCVEQNQVNGVNWGQSPLCGMGSPISAQTRSPEWFERVHAVIVGTYINGRQ